MNKNFVVFRNHKLGWFLASIIIFVIGLALIAPFCKKRPEPERIEFGVDGLGWLSRDDNALDCNSVESIPELPQQRHSKVERDGHAYLLCGEIIIMQSLYDFEHVNFSVSECQICGMLVQTTGDSKESNQIHEVHNQVGEIYEIDEGGCGYE